MKKSVSIFSAILCLFIAGAALGYDFELAQRLESFYRPFEGKETAKQLHHILAPELVEAIHTTDANVRRDQSLLAVAPHSGADRMPLVRHRMSPMTAMPR